MAMEGSVVTEAEELFDKMMAISCARVLELVSGLKEVWRKLLEGVALLQQDSSTVQDTARQHFVELYRELSVEERAELALFIEARSL